jgi:GNAT superfamily N-acetyltransferase
MKRTTTVARTSRRVPPRVRMLDKLSGDNCRDSRAAERQAQPVNIDVNTDLDVAEIAQGDEAALHEYWSVSAAARTLDAPLIPMEPFDELLAERSDERSVLRHRWIARAGDRPVGIALLELPTLDNVEAAHITLEVHPDHRRRGVGRELLSIASAQLRAAGRTNVIAFVAERLDVATTPGVAFAEAVGAKRALDEICRSLELADVTDAQLAAAEDDAATHAAGYELVSWVGACPDVLIEDFARLTGRMTTDAPKGDLDLEPETWDPERVRESEERNVRLRRRWVTTAARHQASGDLVAYTDMGWSEHIAGTAFQWMTIVDPQHRGRHLGLLIKAANLRLLRRELPSAERVITWNAESNEHMIAINERLGFQPQLRFSQWQLRLSP